jgi:Domain of unknown function (DUF4159)
MKPRAVLGLALVVAAVATVSAIQRPEADVQGNTSYDGRFVFVRLRYQTGFGRFGRQGPPWSHDYPRGEMHFTRILNDVTSLRPRLDGSNILALDDPELFKYPIAYMAEPGFWAVTDKEAENFRAYLLKGGFVIFDDFRGPHWDNLQAQMRIVLPDAHWVSLDDGTHPIWHSFFEIPKPDALDPPYGGLVPSYWGIFENNDPARRLVAIANVNNDISEYWEWSGTGYAPVNVDNEAYKYGVNYVIYGLTH